MKKSPSELHIDVPGSTGTTALLYPGMATAPAATLVLAHGAGGGQRTAFLVSYAEALADLGIDVVTFNFLYIEQRRRLPDRAPRLEATYAAVIRDVRARVESASRALVIGGKSMGGRMATQAVAADAGLPVNGLVLLGYPLHPPGRPERRRDAHLPAVARPMLFVQGSRDAFGTPEELQPILEQLQPRPTLHVVTGGDHSFKLTRTNPQAQSAIHHDVQRTIVEWIGHVTATSAPPRPHSA